MSLTPGQQLGPYEIVGTIGKGGMGEVYRARDSRMGREIAIKVAGEAFSDRFSREVQAIATLNHPNICAVHDVGSNYLVMELVEGPTLADRIREGPLPVDEALGIARQIAAALEAAHEKGIVHRDLKPANIKITPGGIVKVLDFGLAKLGGMPTAQSDDSPTLSLAATQAGVIIGTAAYMAPEQARGRVVDKRADIWAFGVVLLEMVTGRRVFQGEDLTDTLASVVKVDPNLEDVPPRLQRLLKKCLQKDPAKRLRDIGDAWDLLDDESAATRPSSDVPRRRITWVWPAAVVLLGVTTVVGVWAPWRVQSPEPLRRFRTLAPAPIDFSPDDRFAVSPDGRYVAISARGSKGTPEASAVRLWVWSLDDTQARALAGTEGASPPFWSPDSRFIGFTSGGALKTVAIAGGPPRTVSRWNPDCLCRHSRRHTRPV